VEDNLTGIHKPWTPESTDDLYLRRKGMNRKARISTAATILTCALALTVIGIPSSSLAAGKFEGVKITANFMASGTYDKAAEQVKTTFEAATGATVEIVAKPFDQLVQANLTDLATGTGQYDVISVTSWEADVYDKLLPLDTFIKRDGYGKEAGFIPGLLRPNQGTEYFDGKAVGVPYAIDGYAMLVRKDLLAKAGVSSDWKTWPEFFKAMNKLKKKLPKKVSPFVFAYGATEQVPAIWLSAYDGYLLKKNGTYGLKTPKMLRALSVVKKSLRYAPSNAKALSIDEANQVFLNGNAAVVMGWPSFVRAAADDPAKSKVVGKWALSSIPGPGMVWLSAWNLGIAKTSKNPEAAWEFIKTYINEKNGTKWMAEFGIGSPFLNTFNGEDAKVKHGHDYPQHAVNLEAVKNAPWSFSAFLDVYSRGTGDFLTGKQSGIETIQSWNKQLGKKKPAPGMVEAAKSSGLMEE
jgi:multiple sugar transport system substrate-binding protein